MVYFKDLLGRKNILKHVCPAKTLVQTFLAFVFSVYRTFTSVLCGIMYPLLFVHCGVCVCPSPLIKGTALLRCKQAVHMYIYIFILNNCSINDQSKKLKKHLFKSVAQQLSL